MTHYNVTNANGDVIASDLTADQAAVEMLTYDGHDFEIRHEDGWFELYVTRRSRAAYGGSGGFALWPDYAGKSQAEVYQNVVGRGGVKGTEAETIEAANA